MLKKVRFADLHEVRWDRVALDPRAGYVARVLFRGEKPWRREHHHTGRGASRVCTYRAWRTRRDWLEASQAAA